MKNKTKIILSIIGFIFSHSLFAQFTASTGYYVGNGTNNRSINIGFKPDILLVKCDLFYAQLTTSTLAPDNTKDMNGGTPQSGIIPSLTPIGFTVNNDVKINSNSVLYNYLAIKAEPGVVEIGSYTGNSTDDRNIVGTSFKPDMVIIISQDNNEKPLYSSSTMGADQSMNFLNSGFVPDQIQAFNSNGFQVGKDKAVNVTGLVYHYIAFKHVPGKIFIGSYTGDGTNNRIITDPGKGSFTMVKMSGQHATCRMWDMNFDKSHYFKNSASVTDRIRQQQANGFQLGANNEVNQMGNVYHYMQVLGVNNVLPVKLISFDAKFISGKVDIEWKTASENNNNYFLIERSLNGINYEPIARVLGKGNSSTISKYNYTDANPGVGEVFYRLKQVDVDGKSDYSSVRKILIANEALKDVSIYPNPTFGNKVRLNYSGNEAFIYLDFFNHDGRKVDSRILANGDREISLPSNLHSGTFIVVGRNEREVVFSSRILKN